MRKSLLIFIGALCLISKDAFAVATKCINLSSSSVCTTRTSATRGRLDWEGTCQNGTIEIKGIGGCSAAGGSSYGEKTDILYTSSTVADNMHCWCRIISPAVSQWVFAFSFTSADKCSSDCARTCNMELNSFETPSSPIRTMLLSDLSD